MSNARGHRARSGRQGGGQQPYYAGSNPQYSGMGARPNQHQPTRPPHPPPQQHGYYPTHGQPPPPSHPPQHGHHHPQYYQQHPHSYYHPSGGQYYPGAAPQGYGQAPAPVPAPAPHLPAQYAAHAHGPPAAGYVQPVNAPAAQYGSAAAAAHLSRFRPSGRKRALLIGINYSGSSKLQGCVRDVTFMVHLLRTKFQFRDADFFVMTDKAHGIQNVHSGRPTRKGILQAMHWLVEGARPGDSLFFHFSGHGSQVRDTSGDEADGYDETILPMDYQSAGHIVDDEIYDIMVRSLAGGARLTAVMDCCHSGTGMDLPYIHDAGGYGAGMIMEQGKPGGGGAVNALFGMVESVLQGKPQSAVNQGLQLAGLKKKKKKKHNRPQGPNPHAGEVLLFSGCRDNQVAADTSQLAGVVTGAMTYCVIEAIENGSIRDWHGYTYRSLLHEMREKLRVAKLKQVPQFSTSHQFDLSSPFII